MQEMKEIINKLFPSFGFSKVTFEDLSSAGGLKSTVDFVFQQGSVSDFPTMLSQNNKNFLKYVKLFLLQVYWSGRSEKQREIRLISIDNLVDNEAPKYSKEVFELATPPENLEYSLSVQVDLPRLLLDFGIKQNSNVDIVSKSEYVRVIENGQNVSEYDVFVLNGGEVWTGDVHFVNNEYRTGIVESKDSQPVSKIQVTNNILQDFRQLNSSLARFINIQSVEQLVSKLDYYGFYNLLIPETRKSTVFSKLLSSRDIEGNIKLVFGIDYSKLIKEKTGFGNLIATNKPDDMNRIIKKTRIKQLKVVRHRVNDFNSSLDFDDSVYDFIASSGDSEDGLIYFSDSAGLLSEVILLKDEKYRFFTAEDKLASKISCGKYVYAVSVSISDLTVSLMEDYRNKLLSIHNNYLRYLNESLLPENYDRITNRLAKTFTEQAIGGEEYIKKSIEDIISSIVLLAGNSIPENIGNTLTNMVTPSRTNPENIGIFVEFVDRILSVYNRLLGDSLNQVDSKSNSVTSGQIRGLVTEEHDFDDVLDFSKKGIGYKYITPKTKSEGVQEITLKDFSDRTFRETERYLVNSDVNVNIRSSESKDYSVNDVVENSQFSYLSPESVYFGNERFLNLAQQEYQDPEFVAALRVYVKAIKEGQTLEDSALVKGNYDKDELVNIEKEELSDFGFTLEPIDTFLLEVIEKNKPKSDEVSLVDKRIIPNSEKLGIHRNLDNPVMFLNELIFPKNKKVISRKVLDSMDKYNVNNSENIFKWLSEKVDLNAEIKRLPNQFKAMLLEYTNPSSVTMSWKNKDSLKDSRFAGLFELNFGLLAKIEVFTGFATGVRDPVWKSLEINDFQTDSYLLCRMSFYENGLFGISKSKELELPVFDSVFLIKPERKK